MVSNVIRSLSDVGRGLIEHRLRVGVTGLSRSGKTVFLTALVQALLHPERLHGVAAVRTGRYRAALLRPQPSQFLPRFPFEKNVAKLTGANGDPEWPSGTTRQAELRVSIRYRPAGLWGRLGDEILHLDLFDYPGEWLLDLLLLEHDFESWSKALLEEMTALTASHSARAYIDFISGLDLDTPDSATEQRAIQAAELFQAYIRERQANAGRALTLHPGRFMLPGELENAPILTFGPLPPRAQRAKRGRRSEHETLRHLMRERFRAYQTGIVRPFHRRHFARLDRQLVLVDALSGVMDGGSSILQLDQEIAAIQQALRLGRSWLPRTIKPSIERVLFACSKADHLPSDQHPVLEELVRRSLAKSVRQARFGGAETEVISLAALRATREVSSDSRKGRTYLAGRPEGSDEDIAHYPGRLSDGAENFGTLNFRPPPGLSAEDCWPHLRLDRAIEFLIGDALT